MDSGTIAFIISVVTLGWFGLKNYIDKVDLKSENKRLQDKIDELKEWIRNSKQ